MQENLITKIFAEEIKDSRCNPTIKVTVFSGDKFGSFSVPSGASTGAHEACVIDTEKAIFNVNEVIAKALIGKNIFHQLEIDKLMIELDGTPNKSSLGGNAMIGVSVAIAKAAAKASGEEPFVYLQRLVEIKPSFQQSSGQARKVPYLFMNLENGGKHARDGLAFQEYLIVPMVEDIKEAVELGIKIDVTLREIIKRELGDESIKMGDEGGFAPQASDERKPLVYLREAIKQNKLDDKVKMALDVASSTFYHNKTYLVDGKSISKEELLNMLNSLIKEFNLFSIEDPFNEEDFSSFAELKKENPNLLVVGDDLTASNKTLLEKAIKDESVNAMIIKLNQIGTLTETLQTMKLARENGIELIVSHRSGETDDDFIADLAYAFGCFGLKAGAPTRPERMVKYERLIKISTE